MTSSAQWRREARLALRYAGIPDHLVPLGNGVFAVIDPEDASRVRQYPWWLRADNQGRNRYAWTRPIIGQRRKLLLHRFVLDAQPGEIVDHINADGLDCRKANMRRADRRINAINRRKVRGAASRYKGVSFIAKTGRWRAMIGKGVGHIGVFDVEEDAARAYDEAARAKYGPLARLNFPREGEQAA
jgi:hypothetical protein